MKAMHAGPFALALLGSGLCSGVAAAQDARTEMEQAHDRYEQAMEQGDAAAVAGMFTEDAIYLSPEGKTLEGRAAIEEYYRALPKFADVEITATHVDQIGDVIIDIGNFTDKVAPEAGGETIEGEYVAIVRTTAEGPKLFRIVTFPKRQPTAAPQ